MPSGYVTFNSASLPYFKVNFGLRGLLLDNVNDSFFGLCGLVLDNVNDSFVSALYLGVQFIIVKGMLDVGIDHRLRKFNAAALNIIMNSKDLTKVERCEIIVKKCLPILMYGMGLSLISEVDFCRMHVAYRKMFRYIFKLPLWAHLFELLGIFNNKSISVMLNNKYTGFLKVNMSNCYDELTL